MARAPSAVSLDTMPGAGAMPDRVRPSLAIPAPSASAIDAVIHCHELFVGMTRQGDHIQTLSAQTLNSSVGHHSAPGPPCISGMLPGVFAMLRKARRGAYCAMHLCVSS